MFNFRLIETADGNQVIDTSLKTPYDSLTSVQMLEYMEVDASMVAMERVKREEQKNMERKQKFTYKFIHKVACMCGIM